MRSKWKSHFDSFILTPGPVKLRSNHAECYMVCCACSPGCREPGRPADAREKRAGAGSRTCAAPQPRRPQQEADPRADAAETKGQAQELAPLCKAAQAGSALSVGRELSDSHAWPDFSKQFAPSGLSATQAGASGPQSRGLTRAVRPAASWGCTSRWWPWPRAMRSWNHHRPPAVNAQQGSQASRPPARQHRPWVRARHGAGRGSATRSRGPT